MNYLAHLFLSHQDEDLLIGNFIADSIRNRDLPDFATPIRKGVHLHRQIDSFTDQHPVVLEATRLLYADFGKYAPVVIDIYFDFLLAKNWKKYHDQTLRVFSDNIYEILDKRLLELPTKMQKVVPRMIASDWLVQYGRKEGLEFTFKKLQNRVRFDVDFSKAVWVLNENYPFFDQKFNLFFPGVVELSNKYFHQTD